MASLILLAALFGLSQLVLFIMDYKPSTNRMPAAIDKAVLAVQRVLFGGPDEASEADAADPQAAVVHSANK